MNFRPLKVLLLSLLLAFTSFLTAQEGGACDLSGPQTLTLTLSPPDVLDVTWSPVFGANSYEVLLVDLDNNQILYNNTVFGTFVSIVGIVPPPNSVVSVAPICNNGIVGGATIESVYHIRIDDLIVQRPGGGTTIYTCPGNESSILEIDWSLTNTTGFGVVNIPITPNYAFFGRPVTKTFVHLESLQPNNNPSANSIAELFHDSAGGNQALFPNQITLGTNTPIVSNTNRTSPNPNNPNQLKITYSPTTTTTPPPPVYDFYSVNLDPSLVGSVELEISTDFENMEISSTNCIEGTPIGSSTLGLQSSENNGQDQSITQRSTPLVTTALTLSPNPVSNRLTVVPNQPGQVTIMDLNGRIWHQEATNGATLNVSVSHWPAGSYILRHDGQDKPFIQRFIKL